MLADFPFIWVDKNVVAEPLGIHHVEAALLRPFDRLCDSLTVVFMVECGFHSQVSEGNIHVFPAALVGVNGGIILIDGRRHRPLNRRQFGTVSRIDRPNGTVDHAGSNGQQPYRHALHRHHPTEGGLGCSGAQEESKGHIIDKFLVINPIVTGQFSEAFHP